jgi:pimeloyl-ACP methyl ester carboxylesterase
VTPRTLRIPDGRALDLWVAGPANGTVLVRYPGTPASGLLSAAEVEAAGVRGLRIVSWSRPGYGDSTRLPGRSVADVVPDFEAVLDQLGEDRAWVIGHSGGGPHALATAALAPDRVLGTALIAGVAPYPAPGLDWFAGMGAENIEEFGAALRGPEALAEAFERLYAGMDAVTADQIAAAFGDLVDEVDRGALKGEYAEFLAAQVREGLRTGYLGWLDDDLAFSMPWGFDLAAIPGRVHVWQGAHDRMVPFAHGRWLAANCPTACPHLFAEHGHLSLAVESFPAILDELIRPAS